MAKTIPKKRPAKATRRPTKYQKSFLTQAIARIDFAEPLGLSAKGPADNIVNSLKRQFPIPERRTGLLKHLTVHLKGEPEEKTTEIREWHYYSRSRHKKLVITDHCMFIEYSKYNRFKTLRDDFLGLANVLFDTYDEVQVKRLGLRYVDTIDLDEPNPTQWSKYLIPDLLTTFTLADEQKTVARTFHVLEILHDDESRIRFQYGMPNPDFPARIKRKVFVLDWDVYCTILLDKAELARFLVIFHERARDAFEQVITEALRDKMGAMYD